MKRKRLPLALTLVSSLVLVACGASKASPESPVAAAGGASPQGAIYDRLGGREGVKAIAETLLRKLRADSRIEGFFRNQMRLAQFEDQLCQLSGGPCHYGGKDMKTAHKGMGISDLEFDAFMEDFKASLVEKGVATADQSALAAMLEPMRGDMVEKKRTK
jgi:hemoglobin